MVLMKYSVVPKELHKFADSTEPFLLANTKYGYSDQNLDLDLLDIDIYWRL